MKKLCKLLLIVLIFYFVLSIVVYATDNKKNIVEDNSSNTNNTNIIIENSINTISNTTSIIEENLVDNNILNNSSLLNENETINYTGLQKIDGIWRMITNGRIDNEYTGIQTNENGTWYVENGIVDFNYTGTYFEGNTAYIIEASKVYAIVDKNTTEVIKINEIWRMVINGKVDYSYTGIGTNDKGTWYVDHGEVDFQTTGIYEIETDMYILENNRIMTEITGLQKIDGIWRMITNGRIDNEYTGIQTNENGTWYVENGIVDFNYTGTYFEGNTAYIIEASKVYAIVDKNTTEVIKINEIWRMVINGKVDYSYTGIGTNDKGTWYVDHGEVDFQTTGIYEIETDMYILENNRIMTEITGLQKIDGIWRMITNGRIDNEYTGIQTNENGTWYVENGIVDFNYTGTYFEGNTAYIIEASKVYAIVDKNTTEVIKINEIWRMVINGKVDYAYTGIGTNDKGTWYVDHGEVDFQTTGIYEIETDMYILENNRIMTEITGLQKIDGIWRMITNGRIDNEYTGIQTNENGTWYVENGIVDFNYTGTYFEGNIAYIIEASKVYAIVDKNTTEVIKINEIWRMVINGKVDYAYTGIGTNDKGTWIVENGEVTFNYTGTYTDETGTYVVENSKIMTDYTKVMRLDGIWRMVVQGKVDFSYTGVGTNEYGTYYLENGEVNFNYTGTYFEGDTAYIVEKGVVRATCSKNTTTILLVNNMWRMVINGVVDYDYTGLGTNENGTYLIQNGEIHFDFYGNYTDSEGNLYNIQKSKVIEVLTNVKYPGTMCIDTPIPNNNYQPGTLNIRGWALSESQNDVIKIYLDDKFYANASRVSREDVFAVYPNQFGGRNLNPLPGYTYTISTAGLSAGKHTLTIVNVTSDGSEIIQSRQISFNIVNLEKTWGIDVSQYQGNIDWNSVRNSGVNFAILRIGYYLESQGRAVIDPYFEQNYNACKSLGIAVGGYFYSYAFNSAEASREAQACLSAISGKSFEMPIFLDVEDNILKNAVADGRTNKNELTNASITFCDIMNSSGYRGGVYASKNFFRDYLNVSV